MKRTRVRLPAFLGKPGKRPEWVRYAAYAAVALAIAGASTLVYIYISYSRVIDARLHGERERTLPRVYARPVELRRGQSLTEQDLISRLNDLGYSQRARPEAPGEFTVVRNAVAMTPRSGQLSGKVVRAVFPARAPGRGIQELEIVGRGKTNVVQLDTPLLTALMTSGGRQKRRSVPIATIPKHMQHCLLYTSDAADE